MKTTPTLSIGNRSSQLWFITEPAANTFQQRYASYLKGEIDLTNFSRQQASLTLGGSTVQDLGYDIVPNTKIAVVSLSGTILKNASLIEQWLFGAADIDSFLSDVRAAFNNPQVDTIVLNLNTPGGDTMGLQEAAQAIRTMAATKQIVAFTDSLCASAGYYLASACSSIFCTNSSQIGCIGTMMMMYDTSALFSQQGVRAILIKSGKFKGQGADGVPITDEMVAHYQSIVDQLSSEFFSFVTANRDVSDNDMQGQIFLGSQAVNNNIADVTVASFSELISLLNATSLTSK